jgi:hypothetical protein
MKKIFIILLSFLLLVSCSTPPQNISEQNQNNQQNNTQSPKYTVNYYFPYKENIRMKYVITGKQNSHLEAYIDFIKNDRAQIRLITPENTVGQVFEIKNGELRLITSRNEFYYRDDLTSSQNKNPEVLLKEPIEKGTTWSLPDGSKRYISGVDVDVKTPSGNYKALEVTTEGANYKRLDYYVVNIGPVKSVYKTNNSEIVTALEKIEENAKLTQTIKLYYPDFLNERLIFTKNKVELSTNSEIKGIFEEYFKKSPNRDITRLMSENAKINKLYLNDSEHKVYVDFSKEFVTEMNAGSDLEADILQAVTNTLADYFNVDKVYISIDGKPYESGHIAIKENEAFFVNYKNIPELK